MTSTTTKTERKAVAIVYVYKSGAVMVDISPEVETTEQYRWICDKLEEAKTDILPHGKTS